MKASAAEQRGTRQSSCSVSVSPRWHLACSALLATTNAKPSLPAQPLIHADSVSHMKAVLYSPCLSSCHVAFLFAVKSFFLSQVRVPEMPGSWRSRATVNVNRGRALLFSLKNLTLWDFFFFPALEQWGHIFIEQAVIMLRCIS